MAGHSYTSQITDPAVQRALIDLQGQVKALVGRVSVLETNALQTTTTLDVKGQRITNLANPQGESDAVTVSYLRAFVGAQGAF